MSTGARRRIAVQAADSAALWDQDPAVPNMAELRTTGGSGLEVSRSSLESAELRSDRMVSDWRGGNNTPGASIPFELTMGTYDTLFESAFFSAWGTDVLKQGSSLKALCIEEGFLDMATPQYRRMKGAIANGFSLSVAPNALVTGSFDFVGKTVTAFSATPFDATVTAPVVGTVIDSFTAVLLEGGSSIATVTSVSFSVANNIEPQLVVGSRDPYAFGPGRARITGSLSAHFADVTLYNKFVNETSSTLSVQLVSGTKSYTFLFPAIRYTGATKNLSETNITVDMPFVAIYDVTENTQIKLTRDLT